MTESQDPIVAAIAEAVGVVMNRGIEVQPMGAGWFIRIAPERSAQDFSGSVGAQAGRSW